MSEMRIDCHSSDTLIGVRVGINMLLQPVIGNIGGTRGARLLKKHLLCYCQERFINNYKKLLS